MNRSDDFMISC